MSNVSLPLVSGSDNKYVLLARLIYGFSVYVFTALLVIAGVFAFRARTAGLRTYHDRRRTATGVATIMRNEGGCLTVICIVSCRTIALLILFFARKQKGEPK